MAEIRDTEKFTTSWKIFSTESSHCLFTLEGLKNSWWINLVYAKFPILVLQEIRQGKNPEIKESILYNLETKALDFFPNYKLEHFSTNEIHLVDNQLNKKSIRVNQVTENQIIDNTIYREDSPFYQELSELIYLETQKTPNLECEYFELEEHIALGFYTKNLDETFTSNILILSKNGEKIYYDTTYSNLKGTIHGIFFVHYNKIIHTNEHNEIQILSF